MTNLNKQNKKNLKDRARKIFNSMRLKSDFPLAMKYVGSFSKPGPIVPRKDGSYDLDIDISSKFISKTTNKVASPGYVSSEMNRIIGEVLRLNEVKKQKKRVIFIGNDTDGYKYNLDISFKIIIDGKISKTLVYESDNYE